MRMIGFAPGASETSMRTTLTVQPEIRQDRRHLEE
jgi:hypothetical protein